jgi:hypothetical protein
MSLINDALKRATSRQPTTIPIDPEPAAPMQPVEYKRRGLPWYFAPALLAIIAVACWFIVKGVQARRQAADPASKSLLVNAREPQPQDPAPTTVSTPVVETAPTSPGGATPTPPTAFINNVSSDPAPSATQASATAPQAAPAPPPEPPKPAFRLQGIFFRLANPSALVNGKSVWVGSRVDGATVKTITRDSLTIEANGETTVLTLE